MVLDGPPQKPAETPPPAGKRGADFHLVLRIVNEDEVRAFAAALPPGSKYLGLFDKDGKQVAGPGIPRKSRVPNFAPAPKAPAPQK
jgi:hypothetical protein